MAPRPHCSSGSALRARDEADGTVGVWLDRWGNDAVVTLVLPQALVEIAADMFCELRAACTGDGNQVQTAELAGLLLGLFDEVEVVTRTKAGNSQPLDA